MREHAMTDLNALSDTELLEQYAQASEHLAEWRLTAGRLEQAIMERADERKAVGIPSEAYDCIIKTTYNYDQVILLPLKEELLDDDLDKCWSPEYTETKIHEARFNMVKLLPMARRYGGKVAEIVERSKVPAGRKLEFKAKR